SILFYSILVYSKRKSVKRKRYAGKYNTFSTSFPNVSPYKQAIKVTQRRVWVRFMLAVSTIPWRIRDSALDILTRLNAPTLTMHAEVSKSLQ
ncbi:MAG: hypothetical protein ACK559_13420, partial [bacterium]